MIPSAVNIARLPQAYVPDTTQQSAQMANVIGGIAKDYQKNKLVDQILTPEQEKAQAGEVTDTGAATLATMFPSKEEMAAEKAALQEGIVTAEAKQKQIAIREQAIKKQRDIREGTRLEQITSNPENMKPLMKLYNMDKGAAKMVLDILKADDAQAKAQMAAESQDAYKTYSSYKVMLAQYGKEEADKLLREKARGIYQQTGDSASVQPILDMLSASPDEALAMADRKIAMAGYILEAPAVQEQFTLADGAQRFDGSGRLIASNDKDRDPNQGRSIQLREQELELEREKFRDRQNELSPRSETLLIESQQAAQESGQQAGQLETLAQEFGRVEDSGVKVSVKERLKAFSGSEDAETLLRKRYLSLRNSQAVKNLPPGVASDKDIELVLSGYLPETANSTQISAFLRGMAKIERQNQAFNEFRADYIDSNGNARGMLKAWKDKTQADAEADPLGLR